jgi:hypothetical protein
MQLSSFSLHSVAMDGPAPAAAVPPQAGAGAVQGTPFYALHRRVRAGMSRADALCACAPEPEKRRK